MLQTIFKNQILDSDRLADSFSRMFSCLKKLQKDSDLVFKIIFRRFGAVFLATRGR